MSDDVRLLRLRIAAFPHSFIVCRPVARRRNLYLGNNDAAPTLRLI
jgi:hypothetical protein